VTVRTFSFFTPLPPQDFLFLSSLCPFPPLGFFFLPSCGAQHIAGPCAITLRDWLPFRVSFP
jgi:hypothetical protein